MTEWTKLDTAGKIEVVKQTWRANAPVSAWAPKGVSRDAVLGVYKRNPELRKTHPLNPPLGARLEPRLHHLDAFRGGRPVRVPDSQGVPERRGQPVL